MKTKIIIVLMLIAIATNAQEKLYPFMIKDINVNEGDSTPEVLTKFGEKLLFFADDGIHGKELWVHDTNSEETFMVKDINPGANGGFCCTIMIKGYDCVYFTAKTDTSGNTLWRSDGTPEGTFMLSDVTPDVYDNFTYHLIGYYNSRIYFIVNPDNNGTTMNETWTSDGTVEGTVKILDWVPAAIFRRNANSVLIFRNDVILNPGNENFNEFWISEGLPNTTVKDTTAQIDEQISGHNSYFNETTQENDHLFITNYGIWVYDGATLNLTKRMHLAHNGAANRSYSPTIYNNSVVYYYNEMATGSPTTYRSVLYRTDLSTYETNKIGDFSSVSGGLFHFNDKLYFNQRISPTIFALYETDGTDDRTRIIITNSSSPIYNLCALNNGLFFTLNGEMHLFNPDNDTVKNVTNSYGDWIPHSNNLIALNGKLYFGAGRFHKYGQELFYMDYPRLLIVKKNMSFGNSSYNDIANEGINYIYDIFGNLIATYSGNGSLPVSGNVRATIWNENNSIPLNYTHRHYEISPEVNASSSTSEITLYYLQSDFDRFNENENNIKKLPISPTDNSGKSNVIIEKMSGTSNDSTGLPNSYTNGSININPDDEKIVWDAENSFWKVTLDVEGFSGFFLKTQEELLNTALELNSQSKTLWGIYPNPTNGFLNFSEPIKEITIYDLVGRIIKSFTGIHEKIEVSDLSKGNYILKGETEAGNKFNAKFIKN